MQTNAVRCGGILNLKLKDCLLSSKIKKNGFWEKCKMALGNEAGENLSGRKTLFPLKRLNHHPSSGPMIRFSARVSFVLWKTNQKMNRK